MQVMQCSIMYLRMKEMDLMSFMINELSYKNTWNKFLSA